MSILIIFQNITSYQKISGYWRRQKKEETNYFKGVFHFKGFSKQTFSLRKHLQQHIDKKNILGIKTGYLINIHQLERPLRS